MKKVFFFSLFYTSYFFSYNAVRIYDNINEERLHFQLLGHSHIFNLSISSFIVQPQETFISLFC